MYELTQKEHDAVLLLNAEYRRSYFTKKALEQQGFYILVDNDGPFMLEDLDTPEADEKATVLPVFAHKDFVTDFIASSDLKEGKAQFITAQAYNEQWVDMLKENEVLIGYMPTGDGDFEIAVPEPLKELKNN